MNCTFCGERIKADTASVTINVAKGHEHEAPSGHFHSAVDNNCFHKAVTQHNRLSCQRLHSDAEAVLGVE